MLVLRNSRVIARINFQTLRVEESFASADGFRRLYRRFKRDGYLTLGPAFGDVVPAVEGNPALFKDALIPTSFEDGGPAALASELELYGYEVVISDEEIAAS